MTVFLYDAWTIFRLMGDHRNTWKYLPLMGLFIVFVLVVVLFAVFVLYHSFLLILGLKSREFLNGKAILKLDGWNVLRRLCVIRPIIFRPDIESI